MKPELQRIAIAETRGWKWDGKFTLLDPSGNRLCNNDGDMGLTWKQACLKNKIPDYRSDLNAMHEVEKVLTEPQQQRYLELLFNNFGKNGVWMVCHATAAQRAEAFLRTLNLWTD